ncbi:hypothetical protein [Pusillimonas sp. ANT_WB101]|uniref:hypothetical protein n=1 Tax=Pusillimonas sp. ANT_WB101 TaxID=2597356 RepID=UPI00165EB1AB|nr:hypothetical protein [Pusillimonas sp. ANT_WB101]
MTGTSTSTSTTNDQIEVRHFKRRHRLEKIGYHYSQAHPDNNAQGHPYRQIPLK